MKNSFNLFLLVIFVLTIVSMGSYTANAQVSTLGFTGSSGTYTEVTGGTLHGSGAVDDVNYTAVSIGFTFTFNGTGYTTLGINTNGFVFFGTAPTGGTYYPISTTTAPAGLVAALGGDLQGQAAAELRSTLEGTTPNQVFTVQWKNFKHYGGPQTYNYQVKLYETSNKVEIVYGTMTAGGGSRTYQVGLRGTSNADYNNRTTTTNWAATTAGGSNAASCTLTDAVSPASGQTFAWQATNMAYVSSTTTQNTSIVMRGTTNNQIIGIQVVTSGTASPLSATQFDLNTTGTTSTSDISNAKIFYTGTSSTFAATGQFGSTNATPSGSYSITGSQVLSSGTNYFWLTYDIVSGATPENAVDAECTSLTVGSAQTPTVTAPAGTRTIKSPLSGTKTIGPGGSFSYLTLTAAIADLNTFGIEGPTVFELQSTYTSAGETYPLTINAISLSSPTNTVTIRPASDATGLAISGTSTTGIVVLNGADYVIFDGRPGGSGTAKELTIENNSTSSTSTANTIRFINDADYNTVQYCTIKGGQSSSTGGVVLFSTTTGATGNDNNTVSNCDITMTPAGRPLTGICFAGTAAKANTSNTISQCNIFEWTGYGINLGSNATSTGISQNNIYWVTSYSSSIVYGIYIGANTVGGTNVLQNKIYNLLTTHATPTVKGIYFYFANSALVSTVANNFIALDESSTTENALLVGIHDGADPGQLIDIYHNTIYIGGSPTIGSSWTAGIYRNYGSTSNYINNIVINNRNNLGATGPNYAIYVNGAGKGIGLVSNYNDYYVSGTGSILGFWETTATADLAAWQTASSQDANSKSKAVTFAGVATGDLHLSGGSIGDVDLIAATGTGIANDFDGEVRDLFFPYMGADENTGSPLPVQLAFFIGKLNTEGTGISLQWETISEINNYGFFVERRADNEQNFIEVENSFVPGYGTTLDPQKYSFIDNTISTSGIYHYRLRQEDNQGLITYSPVVSISISMLSVEEVAPVEFRVHQNYPNPFNPSTQIKFTVEKTEHALVSVFNVLGQEVAVLFNGVAEPGKYYSLKFDGANFTSGLYFYKVVTNSRSEIKKMMLVK